MLQGSQKIGTLRVFNFPILMNIDAFWVFSRQLDTAPPKKKILTTKRTENHNFYRQSRPEFLTFQMSMRLTSNAHC